MIPKNIITIWLSEEPMPELVQKCVATHNVPGYNHIMVTLDNCYNDTPYIQHCLKNKYWVKAADYLRLRYLHELGGIYLDADVEITGTIPEFGAAYAGYNQIVYLDVLEAYVEDSKYVWNGCIASRPKNHILEFMIRTMDNCFNPDGETFRLGMQFFTDILLLIQPADSTYYFDTDRVRLSMMPSFNSWAKHHELKSWVKK
jgi:mannosyltransferase OCH1-like enzyme